MSGGFGPELGIAEVEVIREDGSTCSMPDLPGKGRYLHSANRLTLCGGLGSPGPGLRGKDCTTFTNGQWENSHKLGEERYGHISWDSPNGIVIISGGTSKTTEELSPNSDTSTPSFPLPYVHEYVLHPHHQV